MKLKNIALLLIILAHSGLYSLSINDLDPAELTVVNGILNLSGKGITSLDGLNDIDNPESVTKLDLSYNNLGELNKNDLESFSNLKTLYISSSHLPDLDPESFNGLESLQELLLTNNGIENLPEDIFAPLPNLERLILRINNLKTVPSTLLSNNHNIKTLDLYLNELSSFPTTILSDTPMLEHLNLSDNKLPFQEVLKIDTALQGRNVEVLIANQDVEPIQLTPNITEEEWKQLTDDEKECLICLEETTQEEAYKTACPPKGHHFHAECLAEWLKSSKATACPKCRRDVFTGGESQRMPGEPPTQEAPDFDIDELLAQKKTKSKKKTLHLAKHTKKKHIKIAKRKRKAKVAWA